jgi:hypothetical protein
VVSSSLRSRNICFLSARVELSSSHAAICSDREHSTPLSIAHHTGSKFDWQYGHSGESDMGRLARFFRALPLCCAKQSTHRVGRAQVVQSTHHILMRLVPDRIDQAIKKVNVLRAEAEHVPDYHGAH